MLNVRHPAKYNLRLMPIFGEALCGRMRVLDPFAGTGRIFDLQEYLPGTGLYGVEIEPEWARQRERGLVGSALSLPFPDNWFDAVCTSPCFGNRMADHHEARDTSQRNTYRHALGRPLHPENAGGMQWGPAYWAFHAKAWRECKRVLMPGALFVLDIKNHIRGGTVQDVTVWHANLLTLLGFELLEERRVLCPGNRQGANGQVRIGYESIMLFELRGWDAKADPAWIAHA